jgi:DNA-binding NarL/FixJ family response regulator
VYREKRGAKVSIRVAVWDPLPMFRRGIVTAIESIGFRLEEPDSLLRWAAEQESRAVFLTLSSVDDWLLLGQLHSDWPGMLVIALLMEESIDMYVRALREGATVAVARDARAETVIDVFQAAVGGMSVLPSNVVRALVSANGEPKLPDNVKPHEIDWLRALSEGVTVAALATAVGYSERAMYRLLRDLYERMGVRNRSHAILEATRQGWLQ